MSVKHPFAQAQRAHISYQQTWNVRLARMLARDARQRFAFRARPVLGLPCPPLVTQRLAFNERQRVARANKGLA
jgi:hypothetical protein